MAISALQAKGEFTKLLIDVFQERPQTTSFLRSFFPNKNAPTKYVSVEVERMGERVAVDVVRGTEGNRNTFSKSSEKIYQPPFFNEFFDATELDLYDRVLGAQGTDNSRLFAALLNEVDDKLSVLKDKIERAKEKQCAEALTSGIVTMQNGDSIDFKRKAASLKDDSGETWATGSNDPFKHFKAACEFIRTKGRVGEVEFNAILGSSALDNLLKNTTFLGRQDLVNMKLDAVSVPAVNQSGAAYHGTITAGSYRVNLWTYPQFYDVVNGGTVTSTPYLDDKKVIVLPSKPRFVYAHAAVPRLLNLNGQSVQDLRQGAYVPYEYKDERNTTHNFGIKSAGVPLLVGIDQVYTMKVIA